MSRYLKVLVLAIITVVLMIGSANADPLTAEEKKQIKPLEGTWSGMISCIFDRQEFPRKVNAITIFRNEKEELVAEYDVETYYIRKTQYKGGKGTSEAKVLLKGNRVGVEITIGKNSPLNLRLYYNPKKDCLSVEKERPPLTNGKVNCIRSNSFLSLTNCGQVLIRKKKPAPLLFKGIGGE